MEWGETPPAYFKQLDLLLNRPCTLRTISRAFRWYNLLHLGACLNLDDIIPGTDYTDLPEFKTPNEAPMIEQIITQSGDILGANFARQLQLQHPDSDALEQAEMRRQLRRLITFLFTGEDLANDVPLPLNPPEPGAYQRTLRIDGQQVEYVANGQSYTKYSPLCARLAPLCSFE